MQCWFPMLAIAFLAAASGCSRPSHPPDAALFQTFHQHEADFQLLVDMLRQDRQLQRVDADWTRPEDPSTAGVSAERIAEYRRLFAKLGIPRGFYAFHDPERFTFLASALGLGISGSAKGYAYLENRPDLIVDNLDAYPGPSGSGTFTAYRHLRDHWYLFLESED